MTKLIATFLNFATAAKNSCYLALWQEETSPDFMTDVLYRKLLENNLLLWQYQITDSTLCDWHMTVIKTSFIVRKKLREV
jgi:hypothetical protein